MNSIYLLVLVIASSFCLRCSCDKEGNPDTNCDVVFSSILVNGKEWSPCGGSFSVGVIPGAGTALNVSMNDAVSSTGKSFMLVGSLFSYNGTGVYEPNQNNVILQWNELVDLQVGKVHTAKSGTFEIVEQDDKHLKGKIDCIFSKDTLSVSVKGEFEILEE